ncbi:MAG: 50S ribosomal protein L2 [Candidatus Woykebacteria bacterium RIFCSPHIGHO2_12_FULL_43_10]|uniref:Large ribosomal subunit protein uL2 n=2 Tax=Candidatus Woykeibacteriota TaxID=1817899 RepID=A0A1G1WXF7_9BACT|nr:MAG: 50S ribosomal protein L2 [Candidatus Woykebacteria bacterium RIFCSPHIGHO2_01_FULL_43_29]OGY28699.1 MAG: 50S ribosomal protein L2 [Candidatus Woykebacteria bacterium RIFCSPHIGHO2_02_FULL_43_16b]OGY29774.1 MAG: 50S ribosomal protein L2 [Candidatus Woykebacteria bacterium RIFCSPHIGHO2_12_FULL_43_10]OGY32448.1 MAG: 50S ribosomal protein L2 [Candidatus Woykebacteria bacterium RIFCSPLOWO2_01_FULL_43_14]
MAIKKMGGSTPSRRFMTGLSKKDLTSSKPHKGLSRILPKTGGRDSTGRISVRHQAGKQKRLYREIDFRRDKFDVPGVVSTIEYDPNRSTSISLVTYKDGEKRYILAPQGLKVGDSVLSGEKVEAKVGNASPLKNLPIGSVVHNIEMSPHSGGQLARSAGTYATLMAIEDNWAHLKLPSGEVRKIPQNCMATLGALSNSDWKNIVIGKAGRSRYKGKKPTVRGVAMSPRDHPHGGGEGRSPIGMKSPKSPWGKFTLGKRTRKKTKASTSLILQRRKH